MTIDTDRLLSFSALFIGLATALIEDVVVPERS
jgi:hypothetical protein